LKELTFINSVAMVVTPLTFHVEIGP
jgi:hypothetical protein